MPRRNPRCPDCNSLRTQPIAYAMPSSALGGPSGRGEIAMAWGKRVSEYRWCPCCQARVESERMLESVCHACAEKVLGVVF